MEAMNRKGFVARILAALGVGAVWPSRAEGGVPSQPSPPAPPCTGPLTDRLWAMIARDRAQGLDVNYFHTNRATLYDVLDECLPGWRPSGTGYQATTYAGVKWWGCEDMAHHEILVSDTGIEPDPPPLDDHETHVRAHMDALRRCGICPRCYNRDEEVAIGFLLCRECWEIDLARTGVYWKEWS